MEYVFQSMLRDIHLSPGKYSALPLSNLKEGGRGTGLEGWSGPVLDKLSERLWVIPAEILRRQLGLKD